MNVPVPEIDALDLRLLISLAEGETLAEAARHLSLSPSAVSHRLTRIGQRLGIRLTGNSASRAPKWVLQEALPWLKASLANLEQARQVVVAPRAEHHAAGIARLFAGWALVPAAKLRPAAHWLDHSDRHIGGDRPGRGEGPSHSWTRAHRSWVWHKHLPQGPIQDPLLAVVRPDVITRLSPSLESWPWIGFPRI